MHLLKSWCWNQWAHKPMHGSAVQLLTFKLLIQVNPELSWYGKLVTCFFFHVFFLFFLVSSVKKYDVGKMAAQQSVKLCSSTVHKQ